MIDDLELYDQEFAEEQRATIKKQRKATQSPPQVAPLEELPEEAGLNTTYKPSRFEEGWLLSSLRSFYEQNLITDVLTHVKGGKEASVYCCKGQDAFGLDLVAAKVYRPRQFRNLRNDQMYREGRAVLTSEGREAKNSDQRLMRALGKKTAFGVQVQHTSWLMYEFTTLDRLYRAGAAVPKPIGASENAILMGYVGEPLRAAPTLIEVRLDADEAQPLFAEVMRNIELMLAQNMIHGDLSAYNILYWEGKITLIDFPQVTNSRGNSNARLILQRDIVRVCEYFAQQGVDCNPEAELNRLWSRYSQE